MSERASKSSTARLRTVLSPDGPGGRGEGVR